MAFGGHGGGGRGGGFHGGGFRGGCHFVSRERPTGFAGG
jgi:hypothetical protein